MDQEGDSSDCSINTTNQVELHCSSDDHCCCDKPLAWMFDSKHNGPMDPTLITSTKGVQMIAVNVKVCCFEFGGKQGNPLSMKPLF